MSATAPNETHPPDATSLTAATEAQRDEVSLSPEQTEYLKSQTTALALVRRAGGVALLVPIALPTVVLAIGSVVGRLPLIGWILAIYAWLIAFGALMLGIGLMPFVFLVALPLSFFTRRAKIKQDLMRGTAVRHSGSFVVADDGAAGGKLKLGGDETLSLTKKQLEAIRPSLEGEGEQLRLTGSAVHSQDARLLLAVFGAENQPLVSVS